MIRSIKIIIPHEESTLVTTNTIQIKIENNKIKQESCERQSLNLGNFFFKH